MHVHLLVSKGQGVLCEGLLNGLVEGEIYGPVVAGFEPGPEFEGGQPSLGDSDKSFRGGIGKDQLVLFRAIKEQAAYLILVGGGRISTGSYGSTEGAVFKIASYIIMFFGILVAAAALVFVIAAILSQKKAG